MWARKYITLLRHNRSDMKHDIFTFWLYTKHFKLRKLDKIYDVSNKHFLFISYFTLRNSFKTYTLSCVFLLPEKYRYLLFTRLSVKCMFNVCTFLLWFSYLYQRHDSFLLLREADAMLCRHNNQIFTVFLARRVNNIIEWFNLANYLLVSHEHSFSQHIFLRSGLITVSSISLCKCMSIIDYFGWVFWKYKLPDQRIVVMYTLIFVNEYELIC